ncbi:hypothetical protein [Streptomyces sp. NPDC058572]|uniref:hypothetical protein n=1 Tax=Streptomyces sp. NPDC058572 TaxID=3346546 RepID=UPI0036523AA1
MARRIFRNVLVTAIAGAALLAATPTAMANSNDIAEARSPFGYAWFWADGERFLVEAAEGFKTDFTLHAKLQWKTKDGTLHTTAGSCADSPGYYTVGGIEEAANHNTCDWSWPEGVKVRLYLSVTRDGDDVRYFKRYSDWITT